jgi:DNA-binding FadR family transcriptional regulator
MRLVLAQLANGALGPGDALPREVDMAKEWRVSRTVVRNAIQALVDRGVLEVVHGRGQTVRPAEDWNVLDGAVLEAFVAAGHGPDLLAEVVEARLLVEVPAAGLAAERARRSDVDGLRDACERMGDAADVEVVQGWPDPHADAEADFHRALARATDNRPLQSTLARLHEAMRALGRPPARRRATHVELRAVVAAIAAADADASREAMRAHLAALAAEVPRRRRRRRR